MTRRRIGGLALILLLIVAGVALYQGLQPGPARIVRGPVVEFGVLPPGTPTPANWKAGLVVVRDSADYAASTPRPGQIGTHYEIRPTVVGATPNWSAASTAVAKAAGRGLKTWLSVNIFANGAGATPDVPLGLASWPTVAYDDGCGNTEYAPDYRALATPYAQFVDLVTGQYNGNANVAGYVIGAGADEEAIDTYQNVNDCATKRQNFEKVVSCEAYMKWVKQAGIIWAERTDKPVTLASGVAACVSDYANSLTKTNQQVWSYFYPSTPVPGAAPGTGVTPTPVFGLQYRTNSERLASGNDWDWNSGWGQLQTGQRLSEIGGAAYEFGTLGYPVPAGCRDGFPCAIPTAERVGYTSDAAWQAMSNGAANLFWQCHPTYGCWLDYLTADTRYAITKTMGLDWTNSPAVWVRFADAVKPRSYNRSDQPGPWGFLATARGDDGIQPQRYCAPSVYATAVAAGTSSYATPAVCQYQLSTPVAPESRYAFRYEPNTVVDIDVDDRWTGKSGTFTAWVIYLDSGTDTFNVAWQNAGVEATHTVTKTNTLTWKKESWSLTSQLTNQYSDHDLEIRTLGGAETLYLVWLEQAAAISGPTVTPTWTLAPTPSVTPGATNTPVPVSVASASEVGLPESTTLYASAPTTAHAGLEHDYAGWDGTAASSTVLLRWPTLSLPANSWVVSATLTLYASGPQGVTARLREVARPVDLTAATWTSSGVQTWAAGGGLGPADTSPYGTIYFPVMTQWQPITLRVDQTVKRWLEGGVSNNGWLVDVTSAPAALQAEIAGANHPLVQYRPVLAVYLAFSVAPTATATATRTPTPIATGTVPPTPTGTPTPTATPPAGVWLSELCPNPATDLNLDGRVDANDRAVEIVNWQAGSQDLEGWRLIYSATGGATCSSTVAQTTFVLPRLASVGANKVKVVYGRDLQNLMGQAFTMPGGSSQVTVLLCDPSGRARDGITVPALDAGVCVARSGATWVKTSGPGLGR